MTTQEQSTDSRTGRVSGRPTTSSVPTPHGGAAGRSLDRYTGTQSTNSICSTTSTAPVSGRHQSPTSFLDFLLRQEWITESHGTEPSYEGHAPGIDLKEHLMKILAGRGYSVTTTAVQNGRLLGRFSVEVILGDDYSLTRTTRIIGSLLSSAFDFKKKFALSLTVTAAVPEELIWASVDLVTWSKEEYFQTRMTKEHSDASSIFVLLDKERSSTSFFCPRGYSVSGQHYVGWVGRDPPKYHHRCMGMPTMVSLLLIRCVLFWYASRHSKGSVSYIILTLGTVLHIGCALDFTCPFPC